MASINITKNIIDYTVFEEKLKNCEMFLPNRKPYIIMSMLTFNEIYKNRKNECRIEFEGFGTELDSLRGVRYNHILYKKQYPIYINNNLKYGEIELV